MSDKEIIPITLTDAELGRLIKFIVRQYLDDYQDKQSGKQEKES